MNGAYGPTGPADTAAVRLGRTQRRQQRAAARQAFLPRRGLRCAGVGSIPESFRISHTVEAATGPPRTSSSPWMRRDPHLWAPVLSVLEADAEHPGLAEHVGQLEAIHTLDLDYPAMPVVARMRADGVPARHRRRHPRRTPPTPPGNRRTHGPCHPQNIRNTPRALPRSQPVKTTSPRRERQAALVSGSFHRPGRRRTAVHSPHRGEPVRAAHRLRDQQAADLTYLGTADVITKPR